jgi:hypothetical protein
MSDNNNNSTPSPTTTTTVTTSSSTAAPTEEPKRYFAPPTDNPANEYSREAVPTLRDAAATIKLEDFSKVHLTPCFREANLNGFYAAFVLAGLRFFLKGGQTRDCVSAWW